jgi:hypothetical protein
LQVESVFLTSLKTNSVCCPVSHFYNASRSSNHNAGNRAKFSDYKQMNFLRTITNLCDNLP